MSSLRVDYEQNKEMVLYRVFLSLKSGAHPIEMLTETYHTSSLSLLNDYYARACFLSGALRRAHCETEEVIHSILGFPCCVGTRTLPRPVS